MSASHVGFCALRLEPIWASLGEATGHAAHLCIAKGVPASKVPVLELQQRLHAQGAGTIYMSDVLPGHPDFEIVQWWGNQGGWHGLTRQPDQPGERGKNLHGQYYAAYPYHSADLEKKLDPVTTSRWLKIAGGLGISLGMEQEKLQGLTRGEFLRTIAKDLNGLARTELPRVLIIGDSISMGYTNPVQERLRGKANVSRPAENCSSTGNGLKRMERWLGDKKWDVIHFNFGLHDAKLPPEGVGHASLEDYEKNLRELVARMQKTGAKLIFATTTPVPNDGILSPTRRFGSIEQYNAVAKKVMTELGVEVNDLNAAIAPRLGELQRPNDVHFTDAGSALLAQVVAEKVSDTFLAKQETQAK